MRLVLSLVLAAGIAACGHARDTGPAWPAPATTDEDGGESLEPHESSSVAAAIEDADESEETAEDAAETEDKADDAAPAKDDSSEPSSSDSTPDEPIMTDEIIIEIED